MSAPKENETAELIPPRDPMEILRELRDMGACDIHVSNAIGTVTAVFPVPAVQESSP